MTAENKNGELFAGTAHHYRQYRPYIPTEVIEYLSTRFKLVPQTSVVLDLGCGTGQLTLAISAQVKEVLGVDVDPLMISEAEKARSLWPNPVNNVSWLNAKAEDVLVEPQSVDLITISRAFHWMDQDKILVNGRRFLREGGGIAIIGDGSFWTGSESWQKAIKVVIKRFLGEKRRAGTAYFSTSKEPYSDMLLRHGYEQVEQSEVAVERSWSFQDILGCLYSTSFSAKHLYGNRVSDFEEALWTELGEPNKQTKFLEKAVYSMQSGYVRS